MSCPSAVPAARFYILDEPTTGLHFDDVHKLLDVLNRLVDQGNTVLVIEHNLDVVKAADWVVDLGPEGGEGGGRLVAQGPPEVVAKSKASHTGRFLAELLAQHHAVASVSNEPHSRQKLPWLQSHTTARSPLPSVCQLLNTNSLDGARPPHFFGHRRLLETVMERTVATGPSADPPTPSVLCGDRSALRHEGHADAQARAGGRGNRLPPHGPGRRHSGLGRSHRQRPLCHRARPGRRHGGNRRALAGGPGVRRDRQCRHRAQPARSAHHGWQLRAVPVSDSGSRREAPGLTARLHQGAAAGVGGERRQAHRDLSIGSLQGQLHDQLRPSDVAQPVAHRRASRSSRFPTTSRPPARSAS